MGTIRTMISNIKRLWSFLKRYCTRSREWLRRFSPGLKARRGSVIGVFAAVLLLMGYAGALILRTGWGVVFDVVSGVLISAIAIALLSGVVILVLVILAKLPRVFSGLLAGAWLTLLLLLGDSPASILPLTAGIVFVAALLGGTIAVITSPGFRTARTAKKISVGALLLAATAASVGFFIWVASPGTDKGLVQVEELPHRPVAALEVPDPARPGPFEVKILIYGSGEDRREEFGKDAQLKTKRVDGKAFVNKLDGWLRSFRKGYWGFNRRELPLNGRVWYPAGEGTFPLVLIVHGNHLMREYSDPGYAYLGELLASRGYIFVSVDENFLNCDWSDNYKKENDARGWLMLEHLKVWREWNAEKGNTFHKKVDLDRISLIGHSRGGEAVSVAAAFNRLQLYPDDARVQFDYGFNIRSIIAIAPIDGQYMPSDQSTPLENIDYLLLQGAHDADVSFFSGDRQYKRIKFTENRYMFKTSIYIYRANHGQFNTVWGNRDWGLPRGYLLNTKLLLTGEEQRQIAKVYISAFLDVTLKGEDSYLSIFRDYRVAADWLPKTYYVSRFEDSRTRIVSDFDEDIDVTTTSVKGGSQLGERLATWREEDIGFREGNTKRQNQAVYLGWKYKEEDSDSVGTDSLKYKSIPKASNSAKIDTVGDIQPASYTITLPGYISTTWKVDPNSSLTFSLAEADEKPAKPDSLDTSEEEQAAMPDSSKIKQKNENKEEGESENEEEEIEGKPKTPIDLTIEVQDRNGQTAALPLSEVASLLPPLKAKFTRYGPWEKKYGSSSEPVLQTVEIPMYHFMEVNRRFDPSQIELIRLRFDSSSEGVIILDEVGFRLAR